MAKNSCCSSATTLMMTVAVITLIVLLDGIQARTPSQNGYNLIKHFEGPRLSSYRDSAGVWTIGYGTTFYEDGSRVRPGQRISQARANQLLEWQVDQKARGVDAKVRSNVDQNQFDALVSFTYNLGIGALGRSTLLRKVNSNPNDPSIRYEFMRWNKAGGRVLGGLTRRRQAEADLYFS